MVVLVTGATGFLGPYVVERLISYRQTVRCLIHTPGTERTFKDSSIEIRYGRMTREKGIELVKEYEGKIPRRFLKEFLEFIIERKKYCRPNLETL